MTKTKKHTRHNICILVTTLLFFCTVLISCYTPSPLYGTWADNNGNKISFMADGTFVAQIDETGSDTVNYSGTYTVLDNVLIFSFSTEDSSDTYTRNTEWDIRGSMLYCTWTTQSSQTIKLTLYHISR